MFEMLLIGLPGERPGGLLLTIFCFFASLLGGLIMGLAYAHATALAPRVSFALQAMCSFLRGVPPILLVFFAAHLPGVSPLVAGILALSIYSSCHVGETLRAFLLAYPRVAIEQAHVIPLSRFTDWIGLRLPWTLSMAAPALLTHWISLLKDTGAFVVIGIAELTTVAKLLSETHARLEDWLAVLGAAAALYLVTTIFMVWLLSRLLPDRKKYHAEQVAVVL